MKTSRLAVLCVACVSLLVVGSSAAQDNDWHPLEIETTEVIDADVALSPDGQTLIFTLLGHLFRLPVQGGTAEQLTFGPYYDSEPVITPEGSRVAFISDRGRPSTADESIWSEGNMFVLELETGKIRQLPTSLGPAGPSGRRMAERLSISALATWSGHGPWLGFSGFL